MTAAGVADLTALLARPLTPPAPGVLQAIDAGPIAAADALDRTQLDRLLDPAPLPAETGWCVLPDGVAYVAVRTPMTGVSAEMVDWWFDWHPDDPLRYRIWHPAAHESNSIERPPAPGAKRHWNTVHHPVEDVGLGRVRARIAFLPPTRLGFSTDALDDPRVATIAGGEVGDDTRRMRHTLMVHVFLNEAGGVVLRSRFWLGALIRPNLPGALGDAAGWALNRSPVRRAALGRGLAPALARHCAEEYANLAALLPDIHARFAAP